MPLSRAPVIVSLMRLLRRPWLHVVLPCMLLAALVIGLSAGGRAALGDAVKAVSFVFSDIDNRPVRLTDYRGKWVLVSFWAPWCPLCKVQIPTLNRLNQREDFRVIGIALDYGESESTVREAITRGMRFEAQVLGGSRRAPNSAYLQVGPVDYFPTSYLYDPTGEIVMFIPGQLRLNSLTGFMNKWHAQRQGAPAFAARPELLAAFLRQHSGEQGARAYAEWKALLDGAISTTAMTRLARVNDFFNQRIQAGEGARLWGHADYWASPGEVLGSGRGDDVDIAIAKYFTLLALDLPAEKLRLVYVTARGEKGGTKPRVVLAYYETPDAEPMILDHRVARLLPASGRKDLRPGYSFNSLGVWDETARAVGPDGAGRPAMWDDVLRRARAQGFE